MRIFEQIYLLGQLLQRLALLYFLQHLFFLSQVLVLQSILHDENV
jgi:hypothetical protein